MDDRQRYLAGWNASKRTRTFDLDAAEARHENKHGYDERAMFAAGWSDYAAEREKFDSLNGVPTPSDEEHANERAAKETLVELMVASGLEDDAARRVVDSLTDEQIEQATQTAREMVEEREALRERLNNDKSLCRAVSPARDWKTSSDRYMVARRATQLVDAYAKRYELDVDMIVSELISEGGTIADTIAVHGDDPRWTMYGHDFYAFRWRLTDAVNALIGPKQRAEQDAKWAERGLVRCARCGGAGGASHWPGWTCFDCEGFGAVAKQ